jgi:hypothetical protein
MTGMEIAAVCLAIGGAFIILAVASYFGRR